MNRLSKSPALFDMHKLKWVNNQYVKELDLEQVVELTLPHLQKAGKVGTELSPEQQEWIRKLISLYHEQLSFGAEIVELTDLFFKEDIEYNQEAKTVLDEEQVPEVLSVFAAKLEELEEFTPDHIKASIKAVQKETGHKGKKLFMPIRVAVTGQTHGPELPQSIELIGRETVIKRLKNA